MTYVMSDIHGNLKRFLSVLKQIALKPTDTLYVLGDVIDRYPDGIKILRRLMKMKNVKMLLGNHEYMMLRALDGFEDMGDSFRMKNIWYRNGGAETHASLKKLRKSTRREIFDYLKTLPAEIDITVNGFVYKLVHASPLGCPKASEEDTQTPLERAVWTRRGKEEPAPDGYILIFGHTPTYRYQKDEPLAVFYGNGCIGIDCGCGLSQTPLGRKNGRLACLRLDDMTVFYSESESSDEPASSLP